MKELSMAEKELLLKDLSARLPYGVICTDNRHGASKVTEVDIESEVIYLFDVDEYVEIKNCKPYLRRLSSMTQEEKIELCTISYAPDEMKTIEEKLHVIKTNANNAADFYNKYHFDYRGLIPMGLALEAPEGMYK